MTSSSGGREKKDGGSSGRSNNEGKALALQLFSFEGDEDRAGKHTEIDRSATGSLKMNNRSDEVNLFGKQLSMHIAASNPIALDADKINQEIIDKEMNLIAEELKNSGKPDEITKKISIGKINKFKEENSLMTQDWVMEPKMKVKDVLKNLQLEGLSISEFVRLKIGE